VICYIEGTFKAGLTVIINYNTKLIIQVTILLQFQWIPSSGKRRQVFRDLKTEYWQVHDKLYTKRPSLSKICLNIKRQYLNPFF